ncbi:hypothetical protein HRbin36_01785 [bacterium HR36]|nr:hypothetical protein HRbin36_01785 [bacterium HR36]
MNGKTVGQGRAVSSASTSLHAARVGWQAGVGYLLVAGVILLAGCGEDSQEANSATHVSTTVPSADSVSGTKAALPAASEASSTPAASWKQTPIYAFLHQPFEEAVQPVVPMGARRPPDVTITGKSVGKLYEEVKRRWSEITFATPSGTLRQPIAVMDTELGELELALRPEIAPNHVRAFVALVESGYYDGLFFEIRLGDRNERALPRAIGGGSPEANAQDAASIGFWLKPEILLPEQAKARGVRHQAGTLFCHWLGCFFYIGLNEAPMWDGEFVIFGEVVRNIEVAERIYDRLGDEGNPPQIRSMRITWRDTGKPVSEL